MKSGGSGLLKCSHFVRRGLKRFSRDFELLLVEGRHCLFASLYSEKCLYAAVKGRFYFVTTWVGYSPSEVWIHYEEVWSKKTSSLLFTAA